MAPTRRVLDTSALLSGRPLDTAEAAATIVPTAVLDEMRPGGRDRRHLDNLLAAGATTTDADPRSLAFVTAEAEKAGDLPRLSRTDRHVLAVAHQLGAELWTDDYTIQNVARRLGIPTRSIATRGITTTYRFTTRCTGCKKSFEKPTAECDICGSPTRTVKDRR